MVYKYYLKPFRDEICKTMKYLHSLEFRSVGEIRCFHVSIFIRREFKTVFKDVVFHQVKLQDIVGQLSDFTFWSLGFFFGGGGSFLRLNPWFSVFVTKSNNKLDILSPDHPPEVEQTE